MASKLGIMNIEELKNTCKELFRLDFLEESKGNLVFQIAARTHSSINIFLEREKVENLIKELNKVEISEDDEIYNENYYERAIDRSLFLKSVESPKKDEINEIEYSFGNLSELYILFILNQLKDTPRKDYKYGFRSSSTLRFSDLSNKDTIDFFTFIPKLLPPVFSLVITSKHSKKLSSFKDLFYSYIFTLSYNINVPLKPIQITEKVIRSIRFKRVGSNKIDDIDIPKLKYNNDLILYYQKGISLESIDNQFLSFYHIIEHFFDDIFEEEIIQSIKQEVTKPSFSGKRKTDIKKLIKIIKNKMLLSNEDFQAKNEGDALLLTLKKFIPDTNHIKEEIEKFDSTLIDYYKNNSVSFSQGSKVDFTSNDTNKVFKTLTNRIYKTRNAVVHSKDSDYLKYRPYKNDKELSKEITLVRVIAETIIIKSATDL